MRQWRLKPGDPLALQIAADVGFGPIDPEIDLVWTLDLESLTLRTNLSDASFIALSVNGRTPILHHFAPNYLHATCQSDNGPVNIIWWVPHSHTIAIQVSPADAVDITKHVGGDGWPLPCETAVAPGRFVLSSHTNANLARQMAEQLLAADWRSTFAKIASQSTHTTAIATGDPTWDVALALSQNMMLQQIETIPNDGPRPLAGRATTINGRTATSQSLLDFYVNLPTITDTDPALAKQLVGYYLTQSAKDTDTLPLLTAAVWQLYCATGDRAFLQKAAPRLQAQRQQWYQHDHDQDSIPEWHCATQPNAGHHPLFGPDSHQGLDISTVEAPDLLAYLYRTEHDLAAIAVELDQPVDPERHGRIRRLQTTLAKMWQRPTRSYHYRDRDSHNLPRPTIVLDYEREDGLTAVSVPVSAALDRPNRLILRVEGEEQATVNGEITVEGNDADGWNDRETFAAADITWHNGIGFATGQVQWTFIQRVHATGLNHACTRLQLATPDLTPQDSNLLLPLWAEMAPADQQPHLLRTVLDPMRYWRRFGIPTCAATEHRYHAQTANRTVSIAKNSLIGAGLLAAGKRHETAVLVRRLMQAVCHGLQQENRFRQAYMADEPGGFGPANHPGGLAPVQLFMACIGVQIIAQDEVVLSGDNPFPWPVTLSRHGVTVTRQPGQGAETTVDFPAGIDGRIHQETNPTA